MNKIRHLLIHVGDNLFEYIMLRKLVAGGGELRRLFACNGIKLNNVPINDTKYIMQKSDFNEQRCMLKIGRKTQYCLHKGSDSTTLNDFLDELTDAKEKSLNNVDRQELTNLKEQMETLRL